LPNSSSSYHLLVVSHFGIIIPLHNQIDRVWRGWNGGDFPFLFSGCIQNLHHGVAFFWACRKKVAVLPRALAYHWAQINKSGLMRLAKIICAFSAAAMVLERSGWSFDL